MNSSSKLILGVVILAVTIQWRLYSLNLWPVANILPPLQPFPSNDSRLTGKVEIIGKGDLLGPESLVLGNYAGKEVLFAGLTDGRIVRIEETTENNNRSDLSWVSLVRTGSIPLSDSTSCGKGWFADTSNTEAICGRPLGMQLVKRSTVDPSHSDDSSTTQEDEDVLVIADPYIGLLMITGIYEDTAMRHILATRAKTDPEDTHFHLLNGIVQAPDGSLYITETSQTFQRRRIFYAALDGKPAGRLMRYTKETGQVEVVSTGIFMANGIALSYDQKYLIVVAGVQVLKYSLQARAMEPEPFIYAMPGTGDNLHTAGRLPTGEVRDCYWFGLGSKYSRPFSLLNAVSGQPFIKSIIGALVPYKNFVAAIPKFSALAVFDAATGDLIEIYRDVTNVAPWLSEATIFGEYLYLGSWFNNYLARVKVEDLKYNSSSLS
ncbi:unnamed protein product [Cylindrotheca closterium]|uniref:Strictosidine synthase conserved region domain-containing protein n=1 Tax=Cylindrotheca closterium TaxID=2856 RepID=A0AAD2G2R2_9STRA|nr:unnamed protein product [Cylindrotheca closterium]